MTKSIGAPRVPLRAVELLSDYEGIYGIGINPSAWVRSFICKKPAQARAYSRLVLSPFSVAPRRNPGIGSLPQQTPSHAASYYW